MMLSGDKWSPQPLLVTQVGPRTRDIACLMVYALQHLLAPGGLPVFITAGSEPFVVIRINLVSHTTSTSIYDSTSIPRRAFTFADMGLLVVILASVFVSRSAQS